MSNTKQFHPFTILLPHKYQTQRFPVIYYMYTYSHTSKDSLKIVALKSKLNLKVLVRSSNIHNEIILFIINFGETPTLIQY